MKIKTILSSLIISALLITTGCKVKKVAQEQAPKKQTQNIVAVTKSENDEKVTNQISTQNKKDDISSLGNIIIESRDSVIKRNPLLPVFTSPTWKGCPYGDSACFKKNIIMYIQKHFVYPEEAKKQGLQGRVYVTFEYDEKGALDKNSVKVARGTGHKALDEAAINLILSLPNAEAPGLKDGVPIRNKQNIPISFRLR